MSNDILKSQITAQWDEKAWDVAFDEFFGIMWERVSNAHEARIRYDVAGRPGLTEEEQETAITNAIGDLASAEVDIDDGAELHEYMDEHYQPAFRSVVAGYFRNFAAAMDGAAPEHECWKALAEYGVNSENLLEVTPS